MSPRFLSMKKLGNEDSGRKRYGRCFVYDYTNLHPFKTKMVDVNELCEDGYRLAIQAVDLDKIGSRDAAAFFYIEAAEALIKALSYDPTLDVKLKAEQYIRRAEELRALEAQGGKSDLESSLKQRILFHMLFIAMLSVKKISIK